MPPLRWSQALLLAILAVLQVMGAVGLGSLGVFNETSAARPLSLTINLHPNGMPAYEATLATTDQDDLPARATEFAARHVAEGEKRAQFAGMVLGELLERTGWAPLLRRLGAEEGLGNGRLLLFPIVESGLGRRLLQLACAAQVAEAVNRRLVVLWGTSDHCGAAFHDLFLGTPRGTNVVVVDLVGRDSRAFAALLRPSVAGTAGQGGPLLALDCGNSGEEGGAGLPTLAVLRAGAGYLAAGGAVAALRRLPALAAVLDPDSGASFAPGGVPAAEWRARLHDALAGLDPAIALAPAVRRLVARSRGEEPSPPPASTAGGGSTDGEEVDPTRAAVAAVLAAARLKRPLVGVAARRDDAAFDSPTLSVPVDPARPEGPWSDTGWSEVSLAAYTHVAALALAASPSAAVLVLSNDAAFAEALADAVRREAGGPAHVTVARAVRGEAEDGGDGGGGGFGVWAGRGRGAVMSAVVEWFALSACDLVVGAQGSAFARTASLRSSGAGVEVVPRVLGLLAMDGGLDLGGPGEAPAVPCGSVDTGDAAVLTRAWGLGRAACAAGVTAGVARVARAGGGAVVRRLHVGRPTAEREGIEATEAALRGAGGGQWTVVDVAVGMAGGSGGNARDDSGAGNSGGNGGIDVEGTAGGGSAQDFSVAMVEVAGMSQLDAFASGSFDDLCVLGFLRASVLGQRMRQQRVCCAAALPVPRTVLLLSIASNVSCRFLLNLLCLPPSLSVWCVRSVLGAGTPRTALSTATGPRPRPRC